MTIRKFYNLLSNYWHTVFPLISITQRLLPSKKSYPYEIQNLVISSFK